MRALNLHDDDPVGRELQLARERATAAALASFENDESAVAQTVRQELLAHLSAGAAQHDADRDDSSAHSDMQGKALRAAREAILAMRLSEEIGDAAFHRMEEEIDWLEMADRRD